MSDKKGDSSLVAPNEGGHPAQDDSTRHASTSNAKGHKDNKGHKEHNDQKGHKNHKDKDHHDSDHHKDHPDKDHHDKDNSRKGSKDKQDAMSAAEKCMIINEYAETVETITQQNNNLEKIKDQLTKTMDPKKKKCLEAVFRVEEEKLNEEVIKAMVLQSKCPFEKWPPIPIATTLDEDVSVCKGQDFIDKARKSASEEAKTGSICPLKYNNNFMR